MASRIGSADGYKHLMDLLAQYSRGYLYETSRTSTASGNGTLTRVNVGVSAVAETWTMSLTSGTSFTVVGSVAGTQAAGTVGTAYTVANKLTFLVSQGSTTFSSGDIFRVVIGGTAVGTASRWTVMRFTGSYATATEMEMILRGPGASGTDSIYVGALSVRNDVGDWQNWELAGFTGYTASSTFALQPGYWTTPISRLMLTLWDGAIPFWFLVNERRLVVVAKVSTVYVSAYLGLLQSYASPGQWPLPLAIGGNASFSAGEPGDTSNEWRWSNSSNRTRNYWGAPIPAQSLFGLTGHGRSCLRVRVASGAWRDIWAGDNNAYNPSALSSGGAHYQGPQSAYDTIPGVAPVYSVLWPGVHNVNNMDPALDDSYPLLPNVVMLGLSTDVGDVLGELDGVFRVTGQGLGSEDIIQKDAVDHVVVQDVFRTNREDYAAFALA